MEKSEEVVRNHRDDVQHDIKLKQELRRLREEDMQKIKERKKRIESQRKQKIMEKDMLHEEQMLQIKSQDNFVRKKKE